MFRKFTRILFLTIFAFALFVFAQDAAAQTKKTVRFAAGEKSATLRGRISGYAYTDYLVRAGSGQTISLELNGQPVSPVFSIFQPNGNNLDSVAQSNDYTGTLPVSGVYVVRVGLMRAFARRRQASAFTLKIGID